MVGITRSKVIEIHMFFPHASGFLEYALEPAPTLELKGIPYVGQAPCQVIELIPSCQVSEMTNDSFRQK
jgi:hypothetical protein